MPTLILKVPMDENECVYSRIGIRRALRVLVGYIHIDITDDELTAMWKRALELKGSMIDSVYEIEED